MALDHAALEAAARWYVELRCDESDEATRQAHRRWLDADPGHRLAWERLACLQERFERVAPLAHATLNNARIKRRQALKLLSLLLAAGGTAAVAWRMPAVLPQLADQRTGTGERRNLRLEDGSQLQLNTRTSVDICYSSTLREVQLLRGEILVETTSDTQGRPFIVRTPEGSILALGTRFVVRSEADRTRVCVLQHAVEVRTAAMLPPVRVEAGQQLQFRQNELGTLQPAPWQVDAWTRGMLVVDNWRLDALVNELQRYRPGYLGCAPEVTHLRISGVFQLADINALLENLTSTLPVRIRHFTHYWARVEPA